jgi:alpha-tubulin suppressor-like RCC1 family protein
MQLMSARRAMPLVFAGALLALGCKDETVDPLDLNGPPVAVAQAGGDDQSAPVGNELALPLSVRVTDEDGNPVPAVAVAWTATGGTLSASADTTDANGTASVRWLMPDTPGDFIATAVLPGLGQVEFTGTASPLLAGGELVFRMVDAGGFHACGLTTSDERVCWGYNADGQLGGAAGPPSFFPTAVEDSTTGGHNRFRVVSNGWYHGCSIDFALEVFCWGENRDLRGLDNFIASFQDVDAGLKHSCGITTAREVACWGYNLQCQVGDGICEEVPDSAVIVGLNYASVSAGGQHTCGIQTDGDPFCWGYNIEGQTGIGATSGPVPIPTAVATGLNFQTEPVTTPPSPDPDQPLPLGPYVSAGYAHTCGIAVGGVAHCWGMNTAGQLGDGSTTRRIAPVPVSGGLQFVRISAGLEHTCALTADGVVHCWGDNTWGQLGDGGTADQLAPVAVANPGGVAFAWVSAGENHTCAVTTEGVAWCWGDNHYGQLGTGTNVSSNVPVKVALQP